MEDQAIKKDQDLRKLALDTFYLTFCIIFILFLMCRFVVLLGYLFSWLILPTLTFFNFFILVNILTMTIVRPKEYKANVFSAMLLFLNVPIFYAFFIILFGFR